MESEPDRPQRRYVCVTCARSVPYDGAPPAIFPFCSPRCRMVDLGRWLRGQVGIPVEHTPGAADAPGDAPGE